MDFFFPVAGIDINFLFLICVGAAVGFIQTRGTITRIRVSCGSSRKKSISTRAIRAASVDVEEVG